MRSLVVLCMTAVVIFGGVGCGGSSASTHSVAALRAKRASRTTTSSGSEESSGRSPQNDDYISTYGHEASEPERHQVAQLVSRYYAAALAGRGAAACALVYSSLANSVAEEYGGAVGLRDSSCSIVLPRLFEHVPALSTADLASTRVTGVRLRGARGFVQLSSRGMLTGEIAIQREGGSWKLVALVGRACKRCAAH